MKVTFETEDRKIEHDYECIENCDEKMMLFIHLDLIGEYSDLITEYGMTIFQRHNSKIAITTTIAEYKERTQEMKQIRLATLEELEERFRQQAPRRTR